VIKKGAIVGSVISAAVGAAAGAAGVALADKQSRKKFVKVVANITKRAQDIGSYTNKRTEKTVKRARKTLNAARK